MCEDCKKESLIISEVYFHAIEPTKEALICQIKKVCATCNNCSEVYLLFDHLNDKWDSNIEEIDHFETILFAELRTLLHKNRYCKKCDKFTSKDKCDRQKTEDLPYVVVTNIKKVYPSKDILKK